MKLGIIGAGAMGSIFTYYFHKAGISPVILEKDENIISAAKNGLNIFEGDHKTTIDVKISADPALLKDCEIIFIFVKSYSTEKVIEEISNYISKNSIIVSLQNGIGNFEIITQKVPMKQVVYGSTSCGASKKDLNTVIQGGFGKTVLGGNNETAVKSVFDILKKTGLDISITDRPEKTVWEKAIINGGINPISAILDIPNGEIINNSYSKKLQENIITEAVSVANSSGLKINTIDMIKLTQEVCSKTCNNLCSMLQDITNKRKTEIDSITGRIIEVGKKHSVPTPYNDTLYSLIKAKENSYSFNNCL